MFLVILLLTIGLPASLGILVGRRWPRLGRLTIFVVATLTLPLVAFLSGAGFLVYFLRATQDANVGGEGPAFFGVLVILIALPIGLMLTGTVSGLIAAAFHRRVDRRLDAQTADAS